MLMSCSLSFLADRNPTSTSLPFPLHLRLPCIQGARHGSESSHDDALRARHCEGIAREAKQRLPIQVSVLSERE